MSPEDEAFAAKFFEVATLSTSNVTSSFLEVKVITVAMPSLSVDGLFFELEYYDEALAAEFKC